MGGPRPVRCGLSSTERLRQGPLAFGLRWKNWLFLGLDPAGSPSGTVDSPGVPACWLQIGGSGDRPPYHKHVGGVLTEISLSDLLQVVLWRTLIRSGL